MERLATAAGGDARLLAAHRRIATLLEDPSRLEIRARELAEQIAILAASTLLLEAAPVEVADAFIRTRLAGTPRHTYGQGLDASDAETILARASPRA
jgi:putative acyl-CoA dehydrogenase